MISNTATVSAIALALTAGAANASFLELTSNGGFEAGDTSDWLYFPVPASTFDVTGDSSSGAFAGELVNTTSGSAAIIKQANLGIGIVTAGQEVTISFDAKGFGANGGVAFAEFFSEIDGGGVSSSEILSGAPLGLTNDYQTFSFTTFAGPDVSAGITLQIVAVTGANIGSESTIFIDNVSVSVVPTPASAAILGLGGLAAARRRR